MKKHYFALFLLAFVMIGSHANAQEAATQLAERILGKKAEKFEFVIPSASKQLDKIKDKKSPLDKIDDDYFTLEDNEGKIRITGNNDNSLAMGLNYYLRHYAHVHVSWYANEPVELPSKFPAINSDKPVRKSCAVTKRFFLNYCTFGYTMPWWGWNEWERFIDWMALNGINMPLAQTGQEAVWYEVWKTFGMSDLQIRNYFAAPAHLPWHRMANLDGFQSPLPLNYINDQKELQKKIVARERELGMTPILSGFSGHIPQQIAETFKDSDIKRLSAWCGFQPTYFLNPNDTLFAHIQKLFIEKQTELYGTNHLYSIDLFNEMDPPTGSPEELSNISSKVHNSLKSVDDRAIWVQMGWMFYYKNNFWNYERTKSYIAATPMENMLLLDYFCEKTRVSKQTRDFFGYPFVWCYLGNFGGNTMLVGDINGIERKLNAAINGGEGNLSGIGSTLESFDCSPQIYEYIFERIWEKHSDVEKWTNDWAALRFGKENKNALQAWQLLNKEIYKDWSFYGKGSRIASRPSTGKKKLGTYTNPEIFYNNDSLLKACQTLLKSNSKRDSYNYDLVNLYSQWLGNYFNEVCNKFYDAYASRDLKAMQEVKKQADQIIDYADQLLATHSSFMLGKWIQDARNMGHNNDEKDYYEKNARTILTTWGGPILNDYANRLWSGLVKDYYGQRWNIFFDAAIKAVQENKILKEEQLDSELTAFEKQWSDQNNAFPAKAQGNAKKVAKKINQKICKPYLKEKEKAQVKK